MKIQVSKLYGDATVNIFNKSGELIHTEFFTGNLSGEYSPYQRNIPVSEIEYGHSQSLQFGPFEYKVVS